MRCFNPKREARPSQTFAGAGRRRVHAQFQSQTGSQALSDFMLDRDLCARKLFQSQTGSQALSDSYVRRAKALKGDRFNPKREARPSQTTLPYDEFLWFDMVSIPNGKPGPLRHILSQPVLILPGKFQSQTGSQALSDAVNFNNFGVMVNVSIPNGKPGPLRLGNLDIHRRAEDGFNPKREARPSQTLIASFWAWAMAAVSIPNGKPGPLRLRWIKSG